MLLANQYFLLTSSETPQNTVSSTNTTDSKINAHPNDDGIVLVNEASSSSSPHKESSKCGIYLAPSTIPGAGMGMFAGDRNYAKGEFLADGDLVIPSYDMNWHVGHKNYNFLWDGTCEKRVRRSMSSIDNFELS
jgi:hypothetical protein